METLYRLVEMVSGQGGPKIVPYRLAQGLKMALLEWIR
jgi:hypothetical protein